MGIHGLSKLIGDVAPASTKENEIKNYFGLQYLISYTFLPWFKKKFESLNTSLNIIYYCLARALGRKVAIDASMSIYQFLIAVRSEGQNLANEEGETTRLTMQT